MSGNDQKKNRSERTDSKERRSRENEAARQRRVERDVVRTNHFWSEKNSEEGPRYAERNDDFAYRRKADAVRREPSAEPGNRPQRQERPQRPRRPEAAAAAEGQQPRRPRRPEAAAAAEGQQPRRPRPQRSGESLRNEEHDRARRIARSHARRAADARLEQEEERETKSVREARDNAPAARPQPIGRIVHPSASQVDVVPDDENRKPKAAPVKRSGTRPVIVKPGKKSAAPAPVRRRAALPASSQSGVTEEVSEVAPVMLPIEPQVQENDVVRETISERVAAENGPAKAQLPAGQKKEESQQASLPSAKPSQEGESEDDWAVLLEDSEGEEPEPSEDVFPEIVQDEEEEGEDSTYHSVPAPPRRRTSLFWVFYAVLVVTLIVGVVGVFAYTYTSLVSYEHSQPESIMQSYLEDLKAGGARAEKLKQACFSSDKIGPIDNPETLSSRFDQGVGKSSYRFEEGGVAFDTSAPIYTIYADDQPFLTLHFVPEKSHVSLGLLNITDWGVSAALLHDAAIPVQEAANVDAGVSSSIAVPYNAVVTVNGKDLDEAYRLDEETVLPGFEYAAQFVEVPTSVSYHLEGLRTSPEVSVRNFEGVPIEMQQAGLSFTASAFAETNRTPEQLPIDPLAIGETWSKFMTADLVGNSHGVDQVTSFLIPGSELYTLATTFANSIDITFVSTHVIDSWTEEQVSNCVMYNDSLFSCDVHFVKNMTLNTGVTRADVFSNKMIFAYVDDESVGIPGWYLVNMQAITA